MNVEVWADITCPFTHVGLTRVVDHLRSLPEPVGLRVRAWPLEWVNGAPLDAGAVAVKAAALTEQLGADDFAGFRPDVWPATTVPALMLVIAAYDVDDARGAELSLEIRSLLFNDGVDVSDPAVLADLADRYGLEWPLVDGEARLRQEYDDGVQRGVIGSPHFFHGDEGYFCPSLEIGRDAQGGLTARFDPDDLQRFLDRVGTGGS